MAEYGKKTVAELTEILKSRGLPSSGKKAELIARLNEDDKQAASKSAEDSATEPAQPAPAAQATAQPAEPEAPQKSNEAAADDSTTATVAEQAPETAETESSVTYTLNLKASDLDSEIAKRKARAERFGTGTSKTDTSGKTQDATEASQQQDSEAQKNLERAKRFGTETSAISKLDEALPSERVRGNKRKAPEESPLDDPGLRRGFGGRGRGGRFRRGGGGGGGGGPRNGAQQGARPQGVTKQPAYTSEKDKLAAEARRKKFATA